MVRSGSDLKTHKIPPKIAINWTYSGIDTKSLKFVHIHPPDKTPSSTITMETLFYWTPILSKNSHIPGPLYTP